MADTIVMAPEEEEQSVILRKSEYHTVISEFKYEIPKSEIIETFGSVEEFEKAINAEYGKDPELFIKFEDFMIDRDYSGNREDDWVSDRQGGYEVQYEVIKND